MGSVSALDEAVRDCVSWVTGATKDGTSPHHQAAEVRNRLQIETDTPSENAPPLISDKNDLLVQHRCGRAFGALRRQVKLDLFIRWLYDVEEPRDKYIPLSFVQRAIFQAFFDHKVRPTDESVTKHRYGDGFH